MLSSKSCKNDNLNRSMCMIELIFADLRETYGEVAGGGISNIKAESSTSYSVALPQEERIELFTYEFETKDGRVTVKSKKPSTQSF